MRNVWKLMTTVVFAVFVLAACNGNDDNATSDGENPLQVVTTFTLLEDVVQHIGGDLVDIHNMVPVGTDPHTYEPLPEDIKKATDADILLYNGLNLEGGEHGWFFKLIDSVGQKDEAIAKLSEGVEPKYLTGENGEEEEINPHAFLSPVVGIQMAENARDALMDIDPDHKQTYQDNAETYIDKLKEIDKEYQDKISDIPEENRILITSERAYQYMASEYGLEEGYIWAIDTEENGTPEQITSLIEFINERNVPALFVESNVDKRPMETVSDETGVDIAVEIFSDEIGKKGEKGDTYIKFLEYNIDKIHDGLAK